MRLEYRATTAQWRAERSARRPKRAKLAVNPALLPSGMGALVMAGRLRQTGALVPR